MLAQNRIKVVNASNGVSVYTRWLDDENSAKNLIHFRHAQPHPRPDRIDKKVIDGHVISEQVVFTGSAPTEEPFETLAFDDNIKVTISFFTQGEGANMKSKWVVFPRRKGVGRVFNVAQL